MTESMNKMMVKLDANKELFGDGVYLEICNLMKQTYKEKENEKLHTKIFYKVNFILTNIVKNINDETATDFDVKLVAKTIIVQLAKIQYDWITEAIDGSEHGCYLKNTAEGIDLMIPFDKECVSKIFYVEDNRDDAVLRLENKEYCIISITLVPTIETMLSYV
jgi:hypothetical protein